MNNNIYYLFHTGHLEAQFASTIFQEMENEWGIRHTKDKYQATSDISLFSSSLPVIPHEKCIMVN